MRSKRGRGSPPAAAKQVSKSPNANSNPIRDKMDRCVDTIPANLSKDPYSTIRIAIGHGKRPSSVSRGLTFLTPSELDLSQCRARYPSRFHQTDTSKTLSDEFHRLFLTFFMERSPKGFLLKTCLPFPPGVGAIRTTPPQTLRVYNMYKSTR